MNYETTAPTILLSVILDGDLAHALDTAAAETRSSRAGHARRLLVEALRSTGHLEPLPANPRQPIRHRPVTTR